MNKPRAIFHIDGEAGMRGGERQLLYLASALRARGRRNVIYARRDGKLYEAAGPRGFETRALPLWGEYDIFSASVLAAHARRENALLHAHTAHAAGIARLAALFGAPFIAHRRVDFPISPLSAKFKYAAASGVVCVSRAIAELLASSGVSAKKIAIVPDGLPVTPEECVWVGSDPALFAPPTSMEKSALKKRLAEEFNITPFAPWIGNLAALVPHKDHDTLLAAATIVLMKRPQARFLIAGSGPEEPRLLERIRRMGQMGKIILLGQRSDAAALLKCLDLYVQSSWGEGMGSVLIEATACGTPIVATTAGGIPEVIDNQETGLLVEPRHPEALADAILQSLDKPDEAANRAATGRQRLTRFGLRHMADSMETLYDSIA